MNSVSIHIVTYNNEKLIKKCIRCLLLQTYKNFSILVIDNASLDQTVEICRKLPIQLVTNRKNIGYAAAHNQGVRLTKSKYILTLNADVFLQKDFLKFMVFSLEKEMRVGSAAGFLLRINGLQETPSCIDGTGLFMRKNRRQGLLHEGEQIHTLEKRYILGPDGAAAFYRRKMLEDIAIQKEIFDEDFFMHKEDVDIVWRAQRAGWKSLFVPDAIAWHIRTFRSGQRKNIPTSLRSMALRNRYLLLIKNDTGPYFLRDIVSILFYEVQIFFYVLFFERDSFQAYREAFSLMNTMKKKRTYIQHAWPVYIQPYKYFI